MNAPPVRRVVARALLALDHPALSRVLKRGLEEQNFRVDCISVTEVRPDLAEGAVLVVDVSAPVEDVATLIGIWRAQGLTTPMVALTTSEHHGDQASLLGAGASVCLDKPFRFEELLCLLRELAQRKPPCDPPAPAPVRDLEIDADNGTVKRNGRTIRLTPREFSLLHFLASHRGRVVTRRMIWEQVYNDPNATSNVVDVYIRYLRTKIDVGAERPLIRTIWGRGYSMCAAEE